MKTLFDDYTYEIVDYKAIQEVFKEERSHVFADEFTIEVEKFHTKREKDFLKNLPKIDIYRLYILVYKRHEIIGWHIGFQKRDSFYMMNTAILEKHQGKGIYTKLLKEIIHILKDKGFYSITSRHLASNNGVLIPKLKAGFVITGMEIEPIFGTLVNLQYFFNKEIEKVYSDFSKAIENIALGYGQLMGGAANTLFKQDAIYGLVGTVPNNKRVFNKALFEIEVYYFSFLDSDLILSKFREFENNLEALYSNSREFVKSITLGTNSKKSYRHRFIAFRELMLETYNLKENDLPLPFELQEDE